MGFMDKLVSGKELIGVKKRRSQSYIFEKFEYELQEKRESEGWIVDKELKSMVRMKRPKPLILCMGREEVIGQRITIIATFMIPTSQKKVILSPSQLKRKQNYIQYFIKTIGVQ